MLRSLPLILLGCSWSANGSCSDPSSCRMIVTSNSVYALTPSSLTNVQMKYDLALDPTMKNKVNSWDKGVDIYGKTSYGMTRRASYESLLIVYSDYTRKDGPLGYLGPLGYAGPLGSLGALPKRFKGSMSTSSTMSYWNNWCTAKSSENDNACVYGS
jgi:hypothetical protein